MIHNYIKKNKNGFTILEVLFATIIFSVSISFIFVLLTSLFKGLNRSRDISMKINHTPLIFSYLSPFLSMNQIKEYKSDIFILPQYHQEYMYNEEKFNNFSTLYVCYNDNNSEVIVNKKYYGNIIYKPLKKNKEKT
jgi:prepilin-type N-terminal cleavage/methylation domain-containing protein